MISEERLATYADAIYDYETAVATQDWARAERSLLVAIEHRPCRECLNDLSPKLEAARERIALQRGFFSWAFHVLRVRKVKGAAV